MPLYLGDLLDKPPLPDHLLGQAEDASHQADLRKRREMVAICLPVLILSSNTCDEVERKRKVIPEGEKRPFFFFFCGTVALSPT